MRVRDIYINGLGVYLPEVQSIESAVASGVLPADKIANLGFSGVAVAGDTPAPEMALSAAQDALKDAGVAPDEIALLLYAAAWYQGPTGWQPQFYLQHHLIGDNALGIEINHGCAGTFSGIELAVGWLRADPAHRAGLVVAADNFGTPLMNRWATAAGYTVVGDGAAAVVLTREPGRVQLLSICSGTFSAMEETWRAGEPMFPPGVTVGRPLDFAGAHEAYKKQAPSPAEAAMMSVTHIQRNIECVQRALAEAEVAPGDIKRVITHNMSKEDGRSYLGMLGFSVEQSAWEFGSGVGHIGACDHVLALHHLLTTGQLAAGDLVLLCGIAPGVSYKAAVIRILDHPTT